MIEEYVILSIYITIFLGTACFIGKCYEFWNGKILTPRKETDYEYDNTGTNDGYWVTQ